MKTVKINVTRIDKTALYEGKNGKYLDVVLWDKPDSYGNDGFVTQDIGRERREAGEKGPILGNWKETQRREQSNQPANRASDPVRVEQTDDDIPF